MLSFHLVLCKSRRYFNRIIAIVFQLISAADVPLKSVEVSIVEHSQRRHKIHKFYVVKFVFVLFFWNEGNMLIHSEVQEICLAWGGEEMRNVW